jgi:hypothetical protein
MTFAILCLIHMVNTNVEASIKGEKENRTKSMLNMAFIKIRSSRSKPLKPRCLRACSHFMLIHYVESILNMPHCTHFLLLTLKRSRTVSILYGCTKSLHQSILRYLKHFHKNCRRIENKISILYMPDELENASNPREVPD